MTETGPDEPTRKPRRNDYAPASLVLAVIALVTNLSSPGVCIGIGAAALVIAGLGIRAAVRLDRGMPMSLFGLAFGLLAVFLGAIVLGGQHGAQYSGLAPQLVLLR